MKNYDDALHDLNEEAKKYCTVTQLAVAYDPFVTERSARKKMLNAIRNSTDLLSDLEAAGFSITNRYLYPGQAAIIMRYLGVP